MRGEYMQIVVSGLVQARVADKSVTIGDHLLTGAAGATVAADDGQQHGARHERTRYERPGMGLGQWPLSD